MNILTAIQAQRDRISALRSEASRATEAQAGQLSGRRIMAEKYLTELLAAFNRRLVGDLVEFQIDGVSHVGKVRQLILSPDNVEQAVLMFGSVCHVVPTAELQLAEVKTP